MPDLTNQMSNAACLLATSIATDERNFAASVDDILAGMITIKGAVDQSYLEDRRFEPFMLWLNSIDTDNNALPQLKNMDFGVYQGVIKNWAD